MKKLKQKHCQADVDGATIIYWFTPEFTEFTVSGPAVIQSGNRSAMGPPCYLLKQNMHQTGEDSWGKAEAVLKEPVCRFLSLCLTALKQNMTFHQTCLTLNRHLSNKLWNLL